MTLPDPWQAMVAPVLRPGERMIWSGAPVQGFHQRGRAVLMMVFGLPLLLVGVGLFVAGLTGAGAAPAQGSSGIFLMVVALPLGGIGAFLVFGPLIEARTGARLRHYALTDRAAYILSRMAGARVEVYPILPHTPLIVETGRRAGTVWFHARRERSSDGDLTEERAGFENIADADRVAVLIRTLQETPRP